MEITQMSLHENSRLETIFNAVSHTSIPDKQLSSMLLIS